MFLDAISRSFVHVQDGQATLGMPFPSTSTDWPIIAPRRDYGKWVMGLFEAGSAANGAYVNAISAWTTPGDVVAAISKNANREVVFSSVPNEIYTSIMKQATGDMVGLELSETMQLIGGWNYYGKGMREKQAESDRWLLKGAELISYEKWAEENGPFKYE
jgi:hypothetical protein